MLQKHQKDTEDMFFRMPGNEEASARVQMLRSLLEFSYRTLQERKTKKVCFSLKINAPVRTVEEMLADLSEEELADYCGYIQPAGEAGVSEQYIKTIIETYRAHPEYLLYVFEKEEFETLKKLLAIPPMHSYEISDPNVLFKAVTTGILDAEVFEQAGQRGVSLRFAADAAQLLEKLPETEVKKMYQSHKRIFENLETLLRTYSMVEINTFKEQYMKLFRQSLDEAEWQRCIGLYMCFANGAQQAEGEDGTQYLAIPELDTLEIMYISEDYEVNVPYRQFQKNQLLSKTQGLASLYPAWEKLDNYLEESYEACMPERDFWFNRIYMLLQAGASVLELQTDMEEGFELSTIASRTELWEILTGICMNTPLAFLKAHTRLEYAELTGKQPWELGLYEWQLAEEEPDGDGLFVLTPKQQYELYGIVKKENNSAADILAIKKLIMESSPQTPELKFILAVAYLKNDQMEKGMQSFRELYAETKDDSARQAIDILKELMRAGGNYHQWDELFDRENFKMGEIIPFRRDREKIGRNAPCPCGSGKKFKQCCLGKGIYD